MRDEWERVATTADRLKEVLNEKGMRQAELAEITGIPKSTISRYVAGVMVPKSNTITPIAKALGVDPVWLWGFDVPKHKEKIKNDQIADLVIRLRTDEAFFKLVEELNSLDSKTFDTVAGVVRLTAALGQNSENKI